LLLLVVQSSFIVSSLFTGIIWMVLPASMIAMNDSSSYFFGMLFGKTPLINLSPKKTWEGLILGSICTLLYGFYFSDFLSNYPLFVCPKIDFEDKIINDCEFDSIFLIQKYIYFNYEFNLKPNLI